MIQQQAAVYWNVLKLTVYRLGRRMKFSFVCFHSISDLSYLVRIVISVHLRFAQPGPIYEGDVTFRCNSVWILEPTYCRTTYDVTDGLGVKLLPESVHMPKPICTRTTHHTHFMLLLVPGGRQGGLLNWSARADLLWHQDRLVLSQRRSAVIHMFPASVIPQTPRNGFPATFRRKVRGRDNQSSLQQRHQDR